MSELRRLGDILGDVARHLHTARPETLGSVFGGWEQLVGPAIAAHTRPRSLRDGTLTIGVDDPAWATQLRYLEGDLLARVTDMAGPGSVTTLRILVEPPA